MDCIALGFTKYQNRKIPFNLLGLSLLAVQSPYNKQFSKREPVLVVKGTEMAQHYIDVYDAEDGSYLYSYPFTVSADDVTISGNEVYVNEVKGEGLRDLAVYSFPN